MSQTLTLIRSKADLATPQLTYFTSDAAPTVSALAGHLGSLDEVFIPETDLDVSFSRRAITAKSDSYWIRDAELTSAMQDRAVGADSRLIALALLETSASVISLTSSGIRSAADLAGKRLGIVTTRDGFRDLIYAQQLKVYKTFLSSAGLTLHDVRLVPFEVVKPDPATTRTRDARLKAALETGKDIAERLQQHQFDAIAVNSAADVAHHVSIRILYDTLEHPDYLARAHPETLRGIVVSGHLLRERRDVVVRALARLLHVADWAKARPREAATALAESFAVNLDDLTGKYQNLSDGLQIDLGIEKILTLKAHKNLLLRHRLLAKDFDIDPWIDHGPLVEAHVLYAAWRQANHAH